MLQYVAILLIFTVVTIVVTVTPPPKWQTIAIGTLKHGSFSTITSNSDKRRYNKLNGSAVDFIRPVLTVLIAVTRPQLIDAPLIFTLKKC